MNSGPLRGTFGISDAELAALLLGYVPYTGATTNVDLGAFNLKAGSGTFQSGYPTGALLVGADVNTNTRSVNVRKLASFTAPEFTNSRLIEFFNIDSPSSSAATVSFGGRSGGSQYCATQLNFLTAANTSTTGGTTAMIIDSSQMTRFNNNIGINTAPNSTFNLDAVGASRSGFRFTSGTRVLAFSNFAADLNYLSSAGANLRITTTDATGVEFWMNNTRCASLGAGGNSHFGTPNTILTTYQMSIQPTVATNKGLVIRGFTAQSATLTEWQDSTGAILGAMTAAGRFGLGTITPTYQTQLQGTGLATDGILVSTSAFTSIPNPGSVTSAVLLNPRGFNMCVDGATIGATYQPTLGIGVAVNRAQPAVAFKNAAANPALVIEEGRFGMFTPAPATPIDVRGTIRAGSSARTSFDTRIDLLGNEYLAGGTNVGSGGIQVDAVRSGVGYGFIGGIQFYAGTDTDASRGWAFNANGALTQAATLATSGGQMVLNKAGSLFIGAVSGNANAILDVQSTTKAFMPPRMTTVQKNAIATPTAGMVVYDSTLGKLCVYGAAAWETITSI